MWTAPVVATRSVQSPANGAAQRTSLHTTSAACSAQQNTLSAHKQQNTTNTVLHLWHWAAQPEDTAQQTGSTHDLVARQSGWGIQVCCSTQRNACSRQTEKNKQHCTLLQQRCACLTATQRNTMRHRCTLMCTPSTGQAQPSTVVPLHSLP